MLNLFITHAYLFLIPLAIVEGPFVAIVCGVGSALGYLNPFIAWGILVGGDLLPDLMYWGLGRWGATIGWVRRGAARIKLVREHLPSLEHLWRTRLYSTLLMAKLAWGVTPPFIVSAGLAGVSFSRFAVGSLFISIPYLGFLIGIGYGLTAAYGALGFSRVDAETIVSAAGFIFFCALVWSVRYARARLGPRERRLLRAKSNVLSPSTGGE